MMGEEVKLTVMLAEIQRHRVMDEFFCGSGSYGYGPLHRILHCVSE